MFAQAYYPPAFTGLQSYAFLSFIILIQIHIFRHKKVNLLHYVTPFLTLGSNQSYVKLSCKYTFTDFKGKHMECSDLFKTSTAIFST